MRLKNIQAAAEVQVRKSFKNSLVLIVVGRQLPQRKNNLRWRVPKAGGSRGKHTREERVRESEKSMSLMSTEVLCMSTCCKRACQEV